MLIDLLDKELIVYFFDFCFPADKPSKLIFIYTALSDHSDAKKGNNKLVHREIPGLFTRPPITCFTD